VINNVDNEDEQSHGLREAAKNTGCKSLVMAALKTPDGRLHGCMGVEYVKEAQHFSDQSIEKIHEAAHYISGILAIIHSK
jgi:hypothetical protein